MKNHLKNIKAFIDSIETLSEEEKSMLIKSIKKADEELMILDFKFKRSEKIRKTTTTFLDASVEELENKNKELEATLQKLNTTQAQLIQSEKMASLGELTSGIAHEIQNPLNFVNNFSDVSSEMIDEAIEELDNNEVNQVKDILSDLKGNLEKISHHGNRASSIVKGMLDHSRESSAEKVPTDINALCDEYIRLSFHGFKAKDKSFNSGYETHFDDSIPLLPVVPQDIGRVLLNILNNAFYACAERSSSVAERTPSTEAFGVGSSRSQKDYKPMVTITTQRLNNSTTITISNNGEPIPPYVLDKIFQPFFTTKPTGSGTGLGLSISYDIIKAHNGNMEVSSTDESTTFTITLPTIENKRQPK